MHPTKSSPITLDGQIIRSQSGFYYVKTAQGEYTCRLRGKLKKGPRVGDVAAVGDWVKITALQDGTGMIEEIKPRLRKFSRKAPIPQGEYEQILIANLDQAVLVFACLDPAPRFGMLDRFLVIAEKQNIPALIVVNKTDLVGEVDARNLFERYEKIGYEVIFTSAHTGFGIKKLHQKLINKLSLLTGPSGAGKTSLLNAIQPDLGLQVRSVSQATGKGRHTTVVRQLFPLQGGGYVADTPGMKALALWDIEPEELDGYFPEMRNLVAECQFSDCSHIDEPGCMVREALERGAIHPERYRSYIRMRFGDEADEILEVS